MLTTPILNRIKPQRASGGAASLLAVVPDEAHFGPTISEKSSQEIVSRDLDGLLADQSGLKPPCTVCTVLYQGLTAVTQLDQKDIVGYSLLVHSGI